MDFKTKYNDPPVNYLATLVRYPLRMLLNMSTFTCPDETLKEGFKIFLVEFKKISNDPLVNFDLDKCNSQENICETKKQYIEEVLKKKDLTLVNYFKLKKLATKIERFLKYSDFEELDLNNELNVRKRIEEVLSEKREVFLNRLTLKCPNLFISFDDHKFEALLNKGLKDLNIKCEKIIEKVNANGFFMPDELVSMFRSLCTNVHELSEETFKFMVYNTDVSWLVLFTYNFNDCSHLLKA